MIKKQVTLPNDYERMIPEYHKNTMIYGEHLVRYLAAQKIAKRKIVLDIASGSGYGTASLAKTAKKVYGIDVLADAINYSKENFSASNIEYLQGDGIKIPLKTESVDLVVSFETIEHIEDYDKFMKEIKRVLKPKGLLLLSTPNDAEFAEGNHFHIHEFEHNELKKLLKKYFSFTEDYFQADWIYSGIHPKNEITKKWSKKMSLMNVSPLSISQSLYFFILCSNRMITEKIESIGALSEHWSEKINQNKNNLTNKHIQNLLDISEDRLKYIRKLEADLGEKDETIRSLTQEIESWRKKGLIKHVYHKLKIK